MVQKYFVKKLRSEKIGRVEGSSEHVWEVLSMFEGN